MTTELDALRSTWARFARYRVVRNQRGRADEELASGVTLDRARQIQDAAAVSMRLDPGHREHVMSRPIIYLELENGSEAPESYRRALLQAAGKITQGQRVTFKPEWRDPGDEAIEFIATEDEDGGRVKVRALLGLPIDPEQVVTVDMIESTP